jgi:hypothetical protein
MDNAQNCDSYNRISYLIEKSQDGGRDTDFNLSSVECHLKWWRGQERKEEGT